VDLDLAQQGTYAEDACEIPGTNVLRPDGSRGPAIAWIRVLDVGELGHVRADARAYARARGIEKPTPEDDEYEEGRAIATVRRAFVLRDGEDTPEKRAPRPPYFTEESIQRLHPTTLAFLFRMQLLWQSRCSPLFESVSHTELLVMARKVVESSDERFFISLPLATAASFVRGICVLLLGLPAVKSLLGTPGDSETPSSRSGSESTLSSVSGSDPTNTAPPPATTNEPAR
jgi:hypothetical protein